ncbi:MAG: NUDIX domain-containing protein [Patescibacteria group bacterium]
MPPIQKAGIVVIRKGEKEPEVLLLFQGNQQAWSFPKGHCEIGESCAQTAIREIKEETGLTTHIIRSLPKLEYITPAGAEILLEMFLGAPTDQSEVIQPEHEIDRVEWIPLSKVEETLSYQNLKEYIVKIHKDIVRFE